MVFLQTSCSKETNEQLAAPTAKTSATLSRTHSEVVNFLDEYDSYISGGATDFYDLSREDAEWILEAALNYSNAFASTDLEKSVSIAYEDLSDISVNYSSSTGEVLENTLYDTYTSILSACSSYSNISPINDIEIDFGDPNYTLHFRIGIVQAIYETLGGGIAYTEDAFAVGPVINGPLGPRHICGTVRPWNDPQYYADNMLTKNLGVEFDPIFKQGYHQNVSTQYYAQNAFSTPDYMGKVNTFHDYSSDIWGIGTGDNGEADQCLSPTQLSNYESSIEDWVNTEKPSGLASHNVIVEGVYSNDPTTSDLWYHHRLTFTWSLYTAL